MNTVTQILDTIAEDAARADRSDGQLLDLFVRLRDEDAFARVVRRHGPMVLGVCRRVLGNHPDADDAFQAAFLVLARKAATIGTRHQLAQWLYGVAFNTARKLRRSNARRACRERPLPEGPEPLATVPENRDELLAILDEELNQLPERYRAVVVLCDLEGLTRKEAARALNCPEGTVGGRLARARDLLAQRLARRGVVSAAGALVAALTTRTVTAVPPAALAAVVRAVGVDNLAAAAAQGLISARVAHTTEGVLKTMFANKLRTIAAVLCCGLALACGAGAIHFANAQPTPETPTLNPLTLLGLGTPPAPDKAKSAPEDKQFALIPLKKLDAKPTAEKLAKLLPESVTVAAVRDANALIVYATAKGTDDVKLVLRTLGEELPKDERQPLPEPGAPKPKVQKFTFRMKNASWAEVFEAYSKLSGLTLVSAVKPTGTFTFDPPAGTEYTLAEITDIIDEALAQQKFILIVRHQTFFIQPADEKITERVPLVSLEDLPKRGKREIVQVLLSVPNAETVRDEVKKLLTPFGSIVAIKNALVIQDTAGNITRIKEVLERVEKPSETKGESVLLQYTVTNLDVANVAKDVEKAFPGQKLQVIALPKQGAIMVFAPAEVQETIAKFIRELDANAAPAKENPRGAPRAPKTYSIKFDKVAWKDVFAWYAAETGLTRVGDAVPTGTFTFGQPPPNVLEVLSPMYTLTELTDHINEALLKQNWLLVRNDKSFAVVPADEKVDEKFVTRTTIEKAGEYGRYGLIEVTLGVERFDVAALSVLVRRRVSPFGEVRSVAKTNDLVIRDLAGNLQTLAKTFPDLFPTAPSPREKK